MRSTDILIVDDEIGIRDLLSEILQDEGYGVALAEDAQSARKLRLETRPAMVLLDIWMPDCDGITLLKEWAQTGLLNMPVVMMSGHASIETAIEATKIGAMDFLEKPIALQKLLSTVQRALKYSEMQASANLTLDKLGRSESIQDMHKHLEKALKAKGNIMMTGEPGSPFDIVAQFFQRPHMPWIAPNKAEQWLDSTQDWLKNANNGILYVGNVAHYEKDVQAALINILSKQEKYNVRILSACSRPLQDLLTEGMFEEKLLALLTGYIVAIPPLRNQSEDLIYLINQVLVQLVESKQVRMIRFNTSALNMLSQYNWPGNLEQLRHVIKNLALAAEDGVVDASQVSRILDQYRNRYSNDHGGFDFNQSLRDLREEVEKRYFEYHIRQENSNMSKVAQRVGLERTHLYRKLKQLGIQFSKRQTVDKN